jgi:hypothetical protein
VLDYCIKYDYVTESTTEDEDGRVRYHYDAGPAIGGVFGQGDHEELPEVAREVFEEYPTDDLTDLLDAVFTEYPEWARNAVY